MKTCTACLLSKPFSDFERDKTRKDGRHHACKACRAIYYRERDKNRPSEQKMGYHRNSRKEKQLFLRELKESSPCTDCQTYYPYYVMTFDHMGTAEKSFELSQFASYGMPRILQEIAKCELVCSNCHAIRSWKRANGIALDGSSV